MSQAQDFANAFMAKLAGTATLSDTLKGVFANILAKQVTVDENGVVTFGSSFTILSQVFTYVATTEGRPASPVGYGAAAVEQAKTAAAADTNLSLDPVVPVDGTTFTLTAANDKEVISGTSKSDLFDASELGSLQDDDVILDPTTGDNDRLIATLNAPGTKARIQNVETIEINGQYVATGFDFINTLGAKVATFSTGIQNGLATVAGANTINVAKIVAGTNIGTLNVTSLATGTRDTVVVDAGNASSVKITGVAAVDQYDLTVAKDAKVELDALNSTGDKVAITLNGDAELTSGNGAELGLTLSTNAASKVKLDNAAKAAKEITLTGSNDITLIVTDGKSFQGKLGSNDGVAMTSTNTGTTTIDISALAAQAIAAGNDFARAKVDVVKLSGAAAGDAGIVVNENTQLTLAANVAKDLTVGLDNGNKDKAYTTGALRLEVGDTQANEVITHSTVDTVILSVKPTKATVIDKDNNGFNESTITLAELTLDTKTGVVVVKGDQDIKLTNVTMSEDKQTISASTLTGALNITKVTDGTKDNFTIVGGKGNDSIITDAAKKFDVQSAEGNNTINVAKSTDGTKVTTGTGNDTITSSVNETIINSGAGNDTINAAGKDTITTGAGSDTVVLADNLASVVVKDFETGVDTIKLTGTAKASTNVNVGAIKEVTNGVYSVNDTIASASAGAGVWQITLENAGAKLSTKDLSDSIQLDITVANNSTNVGGAKNDTFKVAATHTATITTGAGSDTVQLAAGAATEATVKDFTVGSDKMIVTGTISDDLGVNLNNVAPTSGKYTIGDAALGATFKLENGGSDITTEGNLTGIVQLGTAAANFVVKADAADVSVTGGQFNDFVQLTVGANKATYNFSNNGGVDTVKIVHNDATTLLNFNNLTGINSGSAKAAVTAKVADAANGGVYVFADSAAGVGGAKITTFNLHTKNGYTQDKINAEVAAFINAGLGVDDGEKYVVVINDNSTTAYKGQPYGDADAGQVQHQAYAYLVEGKTGGITADNITLIGQINNTSGLAPDLITITDIA